MTCSTLTSISEEEPRGDVQHRHECRVTWNNTWNIKKVDIWSFTKINRNQRVRIIHMQAMTNKWAFKIDFMAGTKGGGDDLCDRLVELNGSKDRKGVGTI